MGRLDGKVCVVSGADAGVGRAAAELFCAEGAAVCAAGFDGQEIQRTVARCHGGQAIPVRTDVTDVSSVESMFAAAVAVFGGVDVIFNATEPAAPGGGLERTSPATWSRVLETHATGAYLSCKYGAPHLVVRGGGRIVNVLAPTLPGDERPALASAAARAAVLALTRELAAELGPRGVRVNALSPGAVRRDDDGPGPRPALAAVEQHRRNLALRRFAFVEEIARSGLFLVSDDASYVTGATLVVDGGGARSEPPA